MLFSDGDSAHEHSPIPSGEGLDEDPGRSPLGFFITSHCYFKPALYYSRTVAVSVIRSMLFSAAIQPEPVSDSFGGGTL
jgi:hypothetical protein